MPTVILIKKKISKYINVLGRLQEVLQFQESSPICQIHKWKNLKNETLLISDMNIPHITMIKAVT